MRLLKTAKKQAAVVLTALALTACASTPAPSATEIKVVEKAVMPTPPAALMVAPVRPHPPKDGKTATLLEHAAEFGGYVSNWKTKIRLGATGSTVKWQLTVRRAHDDDLS